jgi:hypothetical protein
MASNSNPYPLAYITLGSTQAYVEFTNIPQGYAHLYFEALAKHNASGGVVLTGSINGDTTAANYSYMTHQGTATSVANAYGSQNYPWFGLVNDNSTSSNGYAMTTLHLPNYSKTDRFKSWYFNSGLGTNNSATMYYENTLGMWKSTSAVSTIRLSSSSGSFVAGCTFGLYGVHNTTTLGYGSVPVTTTP